MSVTGVLFDLDETLFDHEGASAEAVALFLEDRSIQVTPEVLDLWFQSERRRFDEYIDGLVSFEQQRRNRIVDLLAAVDMALPQDLEDLDALFHEYIRLYERVWRPFPDAREAVESVIESGLPVGILTNGLESQQWSKIVKLGFTDLFPHIVTSSAIGVAKPDAKSFQIALTSYAMPIQGVVMVGDNHRADVLGARAAGLRAVYLDRHGSGIQDPHRIENLRALTDVLAALPVESAAPPREKPSVPAGLTPQGATAVDPSDLGEDANATSMPRPAHETVPAHEVREDQ